MRGLESAGVPRVVLQAGCVFLVTILVTCAASAAINPSPRMVSLHPGESSSLISLDISFPPPPFGGPTGANVAVNGLPAGASTSPDPVVAGGTAPGSASASFRIVTSATTPDGTYPLSISTRPDLGAGVGSMTLIVQAPSFDARIMPNPLTLPWGGSQSVTVTTIPSGGFSAPITYAFSGFPAGISSGAAQLVAAPFAQVTFPFAVAPRTPPGSYIGSLVATWSAFSPQTKAFPMTVIVLPPTLTATFSPAAITLIGGGPAEESRLTLTPANGYEGTPSLSWVSTPPDIEVTPATLSSPPLPPPQSLPVSVRSTGVTPGPRTLMVRVVDSAAGVDTTAILVATVALPPDAAITVSPPAISVQAGSTATVTVTATGINGFAGTLSVTAPVLPSVTFTPASFSLRAGASQLVTIKPGGTAAPGTVGGTFSATAPEITGTRTANLSLTVTPQPPEITSATPPALTSGTIAVPVRLTGMNFRTGATVTITPPGPVVTSTSVISPTLAEIVVTTPTGAQTGAYRIDLRNPDGGTTANGAPLVVYPASSLGAPLGVVTAAIVFPRPFTSVANGESVYPRAILATTGVGTIIGTWRLDGGAFDQFVVSASGGLPVDVKATMPIPVATTGEHRLELVIEQPQKLTTEPVPIIVTVESKTRLQLLEPEDGAEVTSAGGQRFRWSLVPGASGYELEIVSEGNERPRIFRLSDSRWSPDERTLDEIGPGTHRWRVAAVFPGDVRGEPTEWRTFVLSGKPVSSIPSQRDETYLASSSNFRFASLRDSSADDVQEIPAEAATAESAVEPEKPRDWEFTLLGSGSTTDEDVPSISDAARIQLTTMGDLENSSSLAKWTGDLSGRKDLDPEYGTASENRAWQLELGAVQSRSREELQAGYSPPQFLDQSEFLAAGLARGGAMGRVATPLGSLSLYDTFHDDAAGAVSAYELEQRLSGAAWEAPFDPNRTLLRVYGLRARGAATAETPETEAEALGVFWRFTASPALTLLVEGAQGSLDGIVRENGDELDGYGLHLGATGARGTFTWGIDFRKVDADFVNPANIGLSAGAVPDRVGGDLTLGKTFGVATLSLQLRTLESGTLPDGSGAGVTENSGTLSAFAPIGTKVFLSATSTLTTTRGDGDLETFLPGSDRSMLVLGLTLTETFKGLALSETLSWQDTSDDVTPAFDSTVTSGTLTAGGTLGRAVILTALFSGTRSESPPPVGVTDLWLASLQPTINWTKTGLAFTPRAAFTRVDSELGGTSDNEQYQLIVQWSPAWWRSLVNVQVGADWNRNVSEGLPKPSFDQRIVASLTLRWGLSRALLAAAPAAPLPAVPTTTASLAHSYRTPAR